MENILTELPSNATSYYQHPTNQLSLSPMTMDSLYTKNQALKTIFESRCQLYQKSTTKVKAVWEEFNIPILERPILPITLSEQDMDTVS